MTVLVIVSIERSLSCYRQFKLWAWLHLFIVYRVLFYDRSGKVHM